MSTKNKRLTVLIFLLIFPNPCKPCKELGVWISLSIFVLLNKMCMAKIDVNGVAVTVVKVGSEDYISLTDMMRSKDGEFFFHNWLRNRNTVEFLGTWEKVFNPEFNSAEFDIIKSKAGLNNFRLSAKEWTEKTHAVGIDAINQLICLSNMESLNAIFINEG